jgi:hypothetical protein
MGILAGCTTTTTAAGSRVRVVDTPEKIAGNCKFVGYVHVDGPVYTALGGFVGAAMDRAIIRKNKTAAMGGDTLLRLDGEDEDRAYLCGSPSQVAQARMATQPNPVPTAGPDTEDDES